LRLVVDASTLVGELLRERGQVLLTSPHLDLYVPARMWDEARHEVSRRLGIRVRKGLPQEIADRFWDAAVRLKEESVTEVPEELYEGLRDEALSRLPRDPDDGRSLRWHSSSEPISSPLTRTSSVAVSRRGRWIP
jgi:hypothetical protein